MRHPVLLAIPPQPGLIRATLAAAAILAALALNAAWLDAVAQALTMVGP
jgi:hypothetical protein